MTSDVEPLPWYSPPTGPMRDCAHRAPVDCPQPAMAGNTLCFYHAKIRSGVMAGGASATVATPRNGTMYLHRSNA